MKLKISLIEKMVKELKRNRKHNKAYEMSITSSTFDVDALALSYKKY